MYLSNSMALRRCRVLRGALLALWVASPVEAAVQYRWVQLAEGTTLNGILQPRVLLRAIVDQQDACPTLHVADGQAATEMTERQRDPTLRNFDDIKLCQAAFDASDSLVQSFTPLFFDAKGEQAAGILPDLSQGVPLSSLVAFGCTGCRGGKNAQQSCDTSSEWFFQRFVEDAGIRTQDQIPPLVAYLGDLRYAGQKSADDSWSAHITDESGTVLGWQEEVFEPTKALMERGLWLMMRGNHEGCYVEGNDWMTNSKWRDRGSAWLYFFGDGDRTCTDVATSMGDVLPPFAMDATIYGGSAVNPVASGEKVRLVMIDTVRTGDDRDKDVAGTRKRYKENFDTVAKEFVEPLTDDRPVWLLGHIPPYGMKSKFAPTVVLEALDGSKLEKHISRIRLAAAAHIHRFNLVNPGTGNPAVAGPVQFVVGNAGVALSGPAGDDLVCKRDEVKWTPDGGKRRKEKWAGVRTSNFGYMIASFSADNADGPVTADYRAAMFSLSGEPNSSLEVACTGDNRHWSRISCPSFKETKHGAPKCVQ